MSDTGVGVKATFSVRGQPVHQFSSSGATDSPSPAAAAPSIGEQGPVEGTDKYDYRYTGIHDHGTLPALKTGGPHGEVVKAILSAKADSDAFLTALISQELAQKSGDGGGPRDETEAEGAALAGSGGGGGGKVEPEDAEPMELDGSGAGGGDAASSALGGGVSPPTTAAVAAVPPSAQPAKRPRP